MRLFPPEAGVPVILAPMAGLADAPFRCTCVEAGASWAVSEMVAAAGRLRSTEMSERRFTPDPLPFPAVQLLGADPAAVADAACHAEKLGAKLIDINFGCPSRMVCGTACGAAVMLDPRLASAVMRAAASAVSVPVTVKMRLGWDDSRINAPELAAAAGEAGLAAVAVHARTRAQRFSGAPRWKEVAAVVSAAGIPVFVNGSIRTPSDALRALEESGAAGVMIGRAAVGSPWIFSRMREVLSGRPDPGGPSREEAGQVVLRHFERHAACWGEGAHAAARFRTHLRAYLLNFGASPELVGRASRLESPAAVGGLLRDFFLP